MRGAADAKARPDAAQQDRWGPFARLTGVISLRSCVHFGLLSFVPVWFVTTLGTSEAAGNAALTAMLAAGAAGTLIGGRIADRIGRRTILLGVPRAGGAGAGRVHRRAHGARLPADRRSSASPWSARSRSPSCSGQEYLPNRLGMASGVTLGAAIGVGGALAPVLGALADAHGIEAAMWVIAALPLPALALALTLPADGRLRLARQVPKTRSPGVAQPRADVGVLVELAVDRRGPDRHVGVVLLDRRQPLRRHHEADQREPRAPAALSRSSACTALPPVASIGSTTNTCESASPGGRRS